MKWPGYVACMGRGEVYTGCWWGNMRERDHLEDQDVDESLILSRIFLLAHDRDRWRALVNAVMNLPVP